ncbi:MAG: MerC domain-containing protein [Planctomycetota bacterium]
MTPHSVHSKSATASSNPGSTRHRILDKLGVFAALACAVHCMAAPLVLAFAPLIGGIWASPGAHWVFAAVSIPAALSLLARNLRGRSGRTRAVLLAVAVTGASLVVVGLLVPGTDWSQAYAFQFAAPDWMPGGEASGATPACTRECCASVHAAADGARTFTLPLASIVTMAGGSLLVVAHAFALRRPCCP